MAAARISALLQICGPSLVVDTHSASAASALDLACAALAAGTCEAAVVGGCFLLAPEHFVIGSLSGALATRCDARSFGDSDGLIYGESAAAVFLKPLSSAERDNDRILALIRATASNCSNGGFVSDSKLRNPTFQLDVVRDALDKAQVPARSITYIDSAANGKPNWDAVEVHTLKSVFQEQTADTQFCAIGSVKSNIGHSGPASALTQLAKIVLQLQHRLLVPTIGAQRVNPLIAFDGSPFYLQQSTKPWQPSTDLEADAASWPRRALLTSHGAGGANVCIVFEEYESSSRGPVRGRAGSEPGRALILLSARTPKQLWHRAQALATQLAATPQMDLCDLAYTLRSRRACMDHRLALIVPSVEALRQALGQVGSTDDLLALDAARAPTMWYACSSERRHEVAELVDGEEEAHLLRKYAQQGNLQKLAFYWTRGSLLPTELMDQLFGGRPIALPTYPFERARLAVGGISITDEIYANTRRRTAT
jgi:acyl transferase domain-containing protein